MSAIFRQLLSLLIVGILASPVFAAVPEEGSGDFSAVPEEGTGEFTQEQGMGEFSEEEASAFDRDIEPRGEHGFPDG